MYMGDVSVINPGEATYSRQAARAVGSAARLRDRLKRAVCRAHGPDASEFLPFSHESCGRLGQLSIQHLGTLAHIGVTISGRYLCQERLEEDQCGDVQG